MPDPMSRNPTAPPPEGTTDAPTDETFLVKGKRASAAVINMNSCAPALESPPCQCACVGDSRTGMPDTPTPGRANHKHLPAGTTFITSQQAINAELLAFPAIDILIKPWQQRPCPTSHSATLHNVGQTTAIAIETPNWHVGGVRTHAYAFKHCTRTRTRMQPQAAGLYLTHQGHYYERPLSAVRSSQILKLSTRLTPIHNHAPFYT